MADETCQQQLDHLKDQMARLTANLERVELEAAEMRAKAATKAEMDADLAEELPTGVSQAVRDLPYIMVCS